MECEQTALWTSLLGANMECEQTALWTSLLVPITAPNGTQRDLIEFLEFRPLKRLSGVFVEFTPKIERLLKRFESDCPLQFFAEFEEMATSANKKSVGTIGFKWSVHAHSKGNAQIRFRVGDKAFSISTGKKSPSALSKTQQANLIREWLELNPVKKRGETDFGEEVGRFIRLQYEGKAEQTVSEVLGHLERLQAVTRVSSVQQLTKKLCEARKPALQAGYSAKTWKNCLTTFKKFARWELGEGNLSEDPFSNFKTPSRSLFGNRKEVWEVERYKATLKALKPADRPLLEVIWETGIDSSDLFQLRPEHILEVRRSDGSKFWKVYKIRAKAKSSLEMTDQPLSTRAKEILLPKLKNWWDFSRYAKGVFFSASLLKKVKRAQVVAGFQPMDIKSIRHTFATRHSARYLEGRGGPPLEELRRWMGHAPDSRILDRLYIHAQSTGLYQE